MSGVANGPVRALLGIPARRARHPECRGVRARCELISCPYHLALDEVGTPNGGAPVLVLNSRRTGRIAISVEASDAEQEAFAAAVARVLPELAETCALHVADQGEHELEELARMYGVTEREMRRRFRAALIAGRAAWRDRNGTEEP